ncbi:MAG: cupin domain-containing protein [Chthoniobacterales bacterium]
MQTADNPWIELCPGIRRQTITSGQTMYQMLAHLDAGSRLPEHRHPQEQITHVIRGRVRMILSGVPRELGAGESLYIPGNIPHGAETIEEAVVIDTFSPPRSEYLALDEQAKVAQSLSRTTRL